MRLEKNLQIVKFINFVRNCIFSIILLCYLVNLIFKNQSFMIFLKKQSISFLTRILNFNFPLSISTALDWNKLAQILTKMVINDVKN